MGDIDISGNKVLTPTALSNKEFAIGADTITVSFNANGGTAPIPASKQVSLGNAYGQLATTTRTGYNFINWLLNSTVITANSIVTEPNNHTLTASWSPIQYNISFVGNGATSGSTPDMTNLNYDQSFNLTANGFVRDGFIFQGWATSPSGGVSFSNQQSIINLRNTPGTVFLYAVWDAATATPTTSVEGSTSNSVTFRITNNDSSSVSVTWQIRQGSSNGTIAASNTQNIGASPSSITVSATGLSSGVEFFLTGVRATASGKSQSGLAQVVSVFTTITASFDTGSGGSFIASQTLLPGGFVTNPGTPTRPGFTFIGWIDGNFIGPLPPLVTFPYQIFVDTVFVAQWEAILVASFNSNGGSPNFPDQTGSSPLSVSNPGTPTRSGFTFLGWIDGNFIGPAPPIVSFPYEITQNTTFIAQWREILSAPVVFATPGFPTTSAVNWTIRNTNSVPVNLFWDITISTPSGATTSRGTLGADGAETTAGTSGLSFSTTRWIAVRFEAAGYTGATTISPQTTLAQPNLSIPSITNAPGFPTVSQVAWRITNTTGQIVNVFWDIFNTAPSTGNVTTLRVSNLANNGTTDASIVGPLPPDTTRWVGVRFERTGFTSSFNNQSQTTLSTTTTTTTTAAPLLSFNNSNFGTISTNQGLSFTRTAINSGTVWVGIFTQSGSGTLRRSVAGGFFAITSFGTTFNISSGQSLQFRADATNWQAFVTLRRNNQSGVVIGDLTISISPPATTAPPTAAPTTAAPTTAAPTTAAPTTTTTTSGVSVPAAPSSVSISSPSANTINFSWPSVSGATSYQYRIVIDGSIQNTGTVTGTSVSNLTVAAGQVRADVRACNSAGCSAYRSSATITVIGFGFA